MKTRIRKNDVVTVISGAHNGSSGKVLSVDREKQRVIVENVNVGRKALRPSQASPQGGLIDRERSIHLSNVMLESEHEARAAKRSGGSAAEETATSEEG